MDKGKRENTERISGYISESCLIPGNKKWIASWEPA